MTIGVLQLELYFPQPQSLKEKRMLLKSLLTRMRSQFNVAVAEIDGMDLWQRTTLAVASVAKDRRQANETLDHVLEFVRSVRGVELTNHLLELL